MTTFKTDQYACPACSKVFSAQTVLTLSHRGQDSDFFPHYVGENPLPFFLVQCPSCSYAAYPEDYDPEKKKERRVATGFIKRIMALPLAKKMPAEALRFFLSARIYEETERNPYHIANLYLRGSWCCRIEEARKAEIELQQLAIRYFKLALDKSTLKNPDNVPVVTYLIGELYRRLEDKKSAREWFFNVPEVVLDSEQHWILELTQKQAELNEYSIN